MDLGRIADARELCATGGLLLLRDDRRVSWPMVAAASAAESGENVTPSMVSKWAHGRSLPEGKRALGLFWAVLGLARNGGNE